MTDWIYDIETYLDLFSACFVHAETGERYIFEASDRENHTALLIAWIRERQRDGDRLFGFNNVGFDWPVLQPLLLIERGWWEAIDAHRLGTSIIRSQDRWSHIIWPSDRIVTQGDLYLIHHFDNMARSTSLKKLEINMRSRNVVDLPYPPDQPTTSAQKDEIIAYMCHDVAETRKFYNASREAIAFRDDLAQRYPDLGDVLNFNDTKIGKQFFIKRIEATGVQCFARVNGKREPVQTRRDQIALRDVISPRVNFQNPEFQRVKDWLEAQVITETKGVFDGLSATVDDFTYDFGPGGIHGSLHSTTVRECDEWEIWDWDVASYYPNLAIANDLSPAHLGSGFCYTYREVYEMRTQHKKGTAENAMLKLALNGVYGDSNNKYSPFFDPQYTMSITINGQLMLCMLAEWLRSAGTEMVQINTDGLTLRVRKDHVDWMKAVCMWWEKHTGLTLESARYREMHIRDVNSYLAVKHDGGVKRIGAYAYETPLDNPYTRERGWHQDHSMLVVRKAAEAQMVHGVPVREFIQAHRDPFDFMLSVKVPRSSRLETTNGDVIQNTTRYYVSTDGHGLVKVMPPLKGKTAERRIGVQQGWTVTVTNDATAFRWDNVNWLYYITEAEKLVIDSDDGIG